jgi:hypothetical protein
MVGQLPGFWAMERQSRAVYLMVVWKQREKDR